jgi:hypothetical protein
LKRHKGRSALLREPWGRLVLGEWSSRHAFLQGLAPCHFNPVWATQTEIFAHPIDKNCGIVWLVTWRVLGFSISSDAQASRVVELTVHQRESEASIGDMLCGANSACLCRATRKPLVTTDFVVQADDAPMPTCLRRDREKNHTTPHLESLGIPISMTLPPC